MPALPSTSLLHTLVSRNAIATNATATNSTTIALQVVCAWPVSGQYGPGSRSLYYILIAACVFARKTDWLRNACLAAALILPAVAAIHGIVLAAVHVDGAVDMDVYGAFQLCSIGILAAPVTVRLSRTYFFDPGRNIIFLWTGVILAGLLSLTAEFFRTNTLDCTNDDSGNPIALDPSRFPYGASCGLTCSVDQGPFSPMRGGSANNIYVIPAPSNLTFNTATLLAAACCIPAVLSLVTMWSKILEINWKSRFGNRNENERVDEPIEGTNGATIGTMKGVNSLIRLFLRAVEIPVFGTAVLAILAIGEINFYSFPVKYQTEPIASIGQWAPIVGTGLALLGSLYLLMAADLKAEKEEARPNASRHCCNCPKHEIGIDPSAEPPPSTNNPGAAEMRRSLSNGGRGSSSEIVPTTTRSTTRLGHQAMQSLRADVGNRRKVARVLTAISNHLGTAAHDQFDDSEFKHGKALDFPEIPGEEHRNSALPQIRERYNQYRDADGNVTPVLHGQSPRVGSAAGSVASGLSGEGSSTMPRASSLRRPYGSAMPTERISSELQEPPSPPAAGSSRGRFRQRRDMLEMPSPVYHNHMRNNPSTSSITSTSMAPESPGSLAIITSSDPGTSSPARPLLHVHQFLT